MQQDGHIWGTRGTDDPSGVGGAKGARVLAIPGIIGLLEVLGTKRTRGYLVGVGSLQLAHACFAQRNSALLYSCEIQSHGHGHGHGRGHCLGIPT